jgi:hypothetical protein
VRCGPEPPGTTLALSAGLVADVWNPPFQTRVTGVVDRIRMVARARTERDGAAGPVGPWVLEDVERTPRWLRTLKPEDPLDMVREDGRMINLAITTNEIAP